MFIEKKKQLTPEKSAAMIFKCTFVDNNSSSAKSTEIYTTTYISAI